MSITETSSSPKNEPADRTTVGPFDEAEVSGVRPWIDLGSIKLIPREGLSLRVEVEDGSKRVVAVALDYLGSTLQVQPFSAPRNEGLWDEIRAQVTQQVTSQGGRVEEQVGPIGIELVATVPTADKKGQTVRFLGVDGPRWFLRGVIVGPAATDGDGRAALVDLYRSLVVVRGATPMPPRELLPLALPRSGRWGSVTTDEVERGTSKKAESTGLAALGVASTGAGDGHPLLRAMGGVLGIFETVVPGVVFLVVYTATGFKPGMPWLAIGLSVGVAAGFTLWRIIRRQALTQALAGVVTVGVSAALAIFSNRPENNFLIGLWTNAGYGTAFLISVLVGWPLAGLFVGLARQEGTAWRANRHHRRVFTGVTLLWVGMFALRLIVEVPLFLNGDVAALAATKLALGLPLYVPVLAVSWLVIRGLYREKPVTQVS